MGIRVEFNPDLALRAFGTNGRKLEECVPQELKKNNVYDFLKKGQRNYYLFSEVPLVITEGDGKLSRPVASIMILEATHFLEDKEVYTKGKYLVKEVFDLNDSTIHFEGMERVK